jgi:large subunit ribosomal protein L34
MSTKRTYQPNAKRAKRKHGFLKRMLTEDGRNVLKRRRDKGRKVLSK